MSDPMLRVLAEDAIAAIRASRPSLATPAGGGGTAAAQDLARDIDKDHRSRDPDES